MQKLADVFKLEYDTVRDLERQGFRAFWISGGILGVGIICALTAVGIIVGIPLMILGGVGFLGAMAWISAHSREPTRKVFCPYCAMSNEVFQSRAEFSCDICNRRVAFASDGEPVAIEEEESSMDEMGDGY